MVVDPHAQHTYSNGPLTSRGDRPGTMLPAAQSETTLIRNGYQSRQQSPQPGLPHSPASYPPPGSTSTSFSQSGMMIQTPQPRPPLNLINNGSSDHQHQPPPPAPADAEWAYAQAQAQAQQQQQRAPQLPPSSRPNSGSFVRPGGDLSPSSTPNYAPNGHGPLTTPVQLRQRT